MTTILVVAGVIAILIVATLVTSATERDRQRGIAAQREPMSSEGFVAGLTTAGVAEDTAQFVLAEVAPWYVPPMTPQSDDRMYSTMRIDDDDMGDIVEANYERLSLPLPPRSEWPIEMPADPTMLEFARWLDDQVSAARQ